MTVLKHVVGALCIISASYVHHVTGKPQSGYISNTSKLIKHILHEIFWNPKNTSDHTKLAVSSGSESRKSRDTYNYCSLNAKAKA